MSLTLEMLLPLAGILLGAKAAAALSQRAGLPAVFGELVLGLVIGPSLLGWVHPNEIIHLLADLGVIVLMFLAGLETDLRAVRQVGKASLFSAFGGVLVPLAGGAAAGLVFGMDPHQALFLGVVLTATSVSITAQTLRELNLFRSAAGMTTMGAAIIDDVLGVLLFALVMSLSGGASLLITLAKMVIFFPAAWVIGSRLLPLLLMWESKMKHREAMLAVIISLLLVYAWAAEALGSVASITGAYLLGVLFARHVDHEHIVHSGIPSIGYGFFIPIFFVNIGLQAEFSSLVSLGLLAGVLSVLAILSKIVGSGGGALLGGLAQKDALLVGCGMVSRGEVALVIAGAGLAAGQLSAEVFALLVFVTFVTTLITPPLLRLVHHSASRKAIYPRPDPLPVYAAEDGAGAPQTIPGD